MSITTRKQFTVLPIVLALLAIGAFIPGLVPVWWHLRHGHAVEYKGKRIPVPSKWYARIEFRNVQLYKLPLTVLALNEARPAWCFLEPNPVQPSMSPDETYKSFEKAYWTLRVKDQDVVTGPIRMGNGESEAICMKSTSARNEGKASASCLLFQGRWMAEFIGDETEVGKFFEVIRGTSSNKHGADPG